MYGLPTNLEVDQDGDTFSVSPEINALNIIGFALPIFFIQTGIKSSKTLSPSLANPLFSNVYSSDGDNKFIESPGPNPNFEKSGVVLLCLLYENPVASGLYRDCSPFGFFLFINPYSDSPNNPSFLFTPYIGDTLDKSNLPSLPSPTLKSSFFE